MPSRAKTHAARLKARRGTAGENRERAMQGSPIARRLRSSARWQKVRLAKLRRDPLCEVCEARDVVTEATQVHHLIELHIRPDLCFKPDNLQSICTKCHAKENARERRRG